ncbi:MAG: phosphate ABC transporter permease PstA [Gammaproteobacteria bacterium]
MGEWIATGSPWVWLTAGAVAVNLVMVLGLLYLIAARGLTHFWPAHLERFDYIQDDGTRTAVLGERMETETVHRAVLEHAGQAVPAGLEYVDRHLYKVGNRDVHGNDFQWFIGARSTAPEQPADAVVFERVEWGNLHGFLEAVFEGEVEIARGPAAWQELERRLLRTDELRVRVREMERDRIGAVNYGMERLRLEHRRLELAGGVAAADDARIGTERAALQRSFDELAADLRELNGQIGRDSVQVRLADGQVVSVKLAKIVRAYRPNAMSMAAQLRHYASKLAEFVGDDPREANTEGGIFPAIFGTVLMVLIMSVFVTPFGVVAAVYLHEYARQGPLVRAIRVAVNNLAGVPSVVYGVFGLGFFVYFIGARIDELFYAESLPSPVFGTPGILWSALTLAILTVPVVIVATEEGLARIPRAIREGSLALGATKAETLFRTVLPMATPAMMTGLILAVARASGEVAPLMLVGVVKLAPTLPLDGNFPFLHLERKFMHLGFHIYDVGFQSPNVEAARPLVYATSMLLVVIIVSLNLAAIRIRNRLREKYNAAES